MDLELDGLILEIVEAVKKIVNDDWDHISSFAKNQSKMLANQAVMITTARTTGSLLKDDEGFEYFMSQLENMTRNLTQSIASLTIVTLEKAWNAVVGVIWGAINGALNKVGLTSVSIPTSPSFQ